MPSPIIKLSSITNLHDARFGAGMGTVLDMMIGFSLNPNSKNYVSEQDFVQISGWITGCKIVAEIENEKTQLEINEEVEKILSNSDYKIDFVQVSSHSDLVNLKESAHQIPIIFSYQFNQIEEIENSDSLGIMFRKLNEDFKIDYFLLESKEAALTKLSQLAIETLQKLSKEFSIILGFGITNENVIDLLSQTELKGIAFTGQAETEVGMGGYTDFDEISDILEKVEEL
ncbi:MAG: hypothetical protein COZ18_00865 [Flexibacter sp. CG_4_10_14_3_um_filter_32_15]|nr:MAG: hypothetical protein COZ18_00865 [Flexibacter sp. CG_4_10_14_3_um_filter_32_15]